ncbi:MAG: hypothetical protein KF861_22010 [Planctomycetaceae bacterium]|uniref:hypothetical protein n=1 Tax=Dokdonella sp. TaxID=2291710 RepID=UPI0027B8804B|nr:hypothetical protein [Dokdonella sp.]MBX3440180.1 hypothetical protein [Planctomycetaceae bacterium]
MLKIPIRRTTATRFLGTLALCATIGAATCCAQSAIVGGFVPTGNLPSARVDLNAVTLPDGHVLLTDGYNVEFYSPSSGTFTWANSTLIDWHGTGSPTPNYATLLSDGRVLFAGGYIGIASAEIYDPSTQTTTAIPPLNEARVYNTATRLLDGRVLITGGEFGMPTSATTCK